MDESAAQGGNTMARKGLWADPSIGNTDGL